MNSSSANLPANVYELLIRGVVDYAIYMLDPNGLILSWNLGAERIKGYTADEIIGQHFSRFYTIEERAAGVPDKVLRLAAENGRFTAEAWRCRKDGSQFWAMVVIDPIYDNGQLIGFAKITRDMTEQRAAQLRALESERRFRLLVQGVTDYAIYTGIPGQSASKAMPRTKSSARIFPAFTRLRMSPSACLRRLLKSPCVRAVMRLKAGGAARMAAGSGPAL
jgi:PAS domain S-box-containing protein